MLISTYIQNSLHYSNLIFQHLQYLVAMSCIEVTNTLHISHSV